VAWHSILRMREPALKMLVLSFLVLFLKHFLGMQKLVLLAFEFMQFATVLILLIKYSDYQTHINRLFLISARTWEWFTVRKYSDLLRGDFDGRE